MAFASMHTVILSPFSETFRSYAKDETRKNLMLLLDLLLKFLKNKIMAKENYCSQLLSRDKVESQNNRE